MLCITSAVYLNIFTNLNELPIFFWSENGITFCLIVNLKPFILLFAAFFFYKEKFLENKNVNIISLAIFGSIQNLF